MSAAETFRTIDQAHINIPHEERFYLGEWPDLHLEDVDQIAERLAFAAEATLESVSMQTIGALAVHRAESAGEHDDAPMELRDLFVARKRLTLFRTAVRYFAEQDGPEAIKLVTRSMGNIKDRQDGEHWQELADQAAALADSGGLEAIINSLLPTSPDQQHERLDKAVKRSARLLQSGGLDEEAFHRARRELRSIAHLMKIEAALSNEGEDSPAFRAYVDLWHTSSVVGGRMDKQLKKGAELLSLPSPTRRRVRRVLASLAAE